eukprot:jgi/Mesvir1/16490/Mv10045-RA.1
MSETAGHTSSLGSAGGGLEAALPGGRPWRLTGGSGRLLVSPAPDGAGVFQQHTRIPSPGAEVAMTRQGLNNIGTASDVRVAADGGAGIGLSPPTPELHWLQLDPNRPRSSEEMSATAMQQLGLRPPPSKGGARTPLSPTSGAGDGQPVLSPRGTRPAGGKPPRLSVSGRAPVVMNCVSDDNESLDPSQPGGGGASRDGSHGRRSVSHGVDAAALQLSRDPGVDRTGIAIDAAASLRKVYGTGERAQEDRGLNGLSEPNGLNGRNRPDNYSTIGLNNGMNGVNGLPKREDSTGNRLDGLPHGKTMDGLLPFQVPSASGGMNSNGEVSPCSAADRIAGAEGLFGNRFPGTDTHHTSPLASPKSLNHSPKPLGGGRRQSVANNDKGSGRVSASSRRTVANANEGGQVPPPPRDGKYGRTVAINSWLEAQDPSQFKEPNRRNSVVGPGLEMGLLGGPGLDISDLPDTYAGEDLEPSSDHKADGCPKKGGLKKGGGGSDRSGAATKPRLSISAAINGVVSQGAAGGTVTGQPRGVRWGAAATQEAVELADPEDSQRGLLGPRLQGDPSRSERRDRSWSAGPLGRVLAGMFSSDRGPDMQRRGGTAPGELGHVTASGRYGRASGGMSMTPRGILTSTSRDAAGTDSTGMDMKGSGLLTRTNTGRWGGDLLSSNPKPRSSQYLGVHFLVDTKSALDRALGVLPLMEPSSRASRAWALLRNLLLIVELWMLPWRIALGRIPHLGVDLAVDALLLVDIVLTAVTPFPKQPESASRSNGGKGFLRVSNSASSTANGAGKGPSMGASWAAACGKGFTSSGGGSTRIGSSTSMNTNGKGPQVNGASAGFIPGQGRPRRDPQNDGWSLSQGGGNGGDEGEGLCRDRVAILSRYAAPSLGWLRDDSAQGRLVPDLSCYLLYLALLFSGRVQDMVMLVSLTRVVRVVRLWGYARALERDIHANVRRVAFVKFLVLVVGVSHMTGCVYYWLARLKHMEDITWVAQVVRNKTYLPGLDTLAATYGLIIYKGFLAMASLGFGPIHATSYEMVFAIIVLFVQVVVYAYILGTIQHYLVRKDPAAEAQRKQLMALDAYCVSRKLPPELCRRMHEYFMFQFSKRKGDLNQITKALPAVLQVRVAAARYRCVVDRARFLFQNCDQQFLSLLMARLREVFLMPGEKLFRGHDISSEVCFIFQGKLDVVDEDEKLVERVYPGEDRRSVVGDVAFFLCMGQPYTVRASSGGDALVLSLSRADYEDLITLFPEQNVTIIKGLLRHYGLDLSGKDLAVDRRKMRMAKKGRHTRHFKRLKRTIRSLLIKRHDEHMVNLKHAASCPACGDAAAVALILQTGFDPNNVDYDNRTALHMAAMSGKEDIVRLLLAKGAVVNHKDRWGRVPLQDAVENKRTIIASLLLEKGATMELDDPAGLLCKAASDNDLVLMKSLIDHNVDPNASDYDKRTPLHVAAAEGKTEIVEFLIAHEADVNVVDRWGATPLDDAVKFGHEWVARVIRTHGGVIKSGQSVGLLYSAANDGDVVRLNLLLENGVPMNTDDRTPLAVAASEGQILSVDFLLSHKADVDILDRWGGTPMWDALKSKRFRVAKMLQCAGGHLGAAGELPEAKEAMAQHVDPVCIREINREIRSALTGSMAKDRLLGFVDGADEMSQKQLVICHLVGLLSSAAALVAELDATSARHVAALSPSLELMQCVLFHEDMNLRDRMAQLSLSVVPKDTTRDDSAHGTLGAPPEDTDIYLDEGSHHDHGATTGVVAGGVTNTGTTAGATKDLNGKAATAGAVQPAPSAAAQGNSKSPAQRGGIAVGGHRQSGSAEKPGAGTGRVTKSLSPRAGKGAPDPAGVGILGIPPAKGKGGVKEAGGFKLTKREKMQHLHKLMIRLPVVADAFAALRALGRDLGLPGRLRDLGRIERGLRRLVWARVRGSEAAETKAMMKARALLGVLAPVPGMPSAQGAGAHSLFPSSAPPGAAVVTTGVPASSFPPGSSHANISEIVGQAPEFSGSLDGGLNASLNGGHVVSGSCLGGMNGGLVAGSTYPPGPGVAAGIPADAAVVTTYRSAPGVPVTIMQENNPNKVLAALREAYMAAAESLLAAMAQLFAGMKVTAKREQLEAILAEGGLTQPGVADARAAVHLQQVLAQPRLEHAASAATPVGLMQRLFVSPTFRRVAGGMKVGAGDQLAEGGGALPWKVKQSLLLLSDMYAVFSDEAPVGEGIRGAALEDMKDVLGVMVGGLMEEMLLRQQINGEDPGLSAAQFAMVFLEWAGVNTLEQGRSWRGDGGQGLLLLGSSDDRQRRRMSNNTEISSVLTDGSSRSGSGGGGSDGRGSGEGSQEEDRGDESEEEEEDGIGWGVGPGDAHGWTPLNADDPGDGDEDRVEWIRLLERQHKKKKGVPGARSATQSKAAALSVKALTQALADRRKKMEAIAVAAAAGGKAFGMGASAKGSASGGVRKPKSSASGAGDDEARSMSSADESEVDEATLQARSALKRGGSVASSGGHTRIDTRENALYHLIILPNCALNRRRAFVVKWVSLVAALDIPFRIAFASSLGDLYVACLSVTDAVIIFDVLANFLTAFTDAQSILHYKFADIFRRYLQKGRLLRDLLGAVPIDLLLFLSLRRSQSDNARTLPPWLRLFKLSYLAGVYWDRSGPAADASLKSQRVTESFGGSLASIIRIMLVVLHLCACAWCFIGRHEDNADWASEFLDYADLDEDIPGQYLLGYYWAAQTMSTNGLVGNMQPRSLAEVLLTLAVLVGNLTVYAFCVSEMTNLVMRQDEELVRSRADVSLMHAFIQTSGLPPDIAKEVKTHFDFMTATRRGSNERSDIEVFRRLSSTLRADVASAISLPLLQLCPTFNGCEDDFLELLSAVVIEEVREPGEYLYRTDDEALNMFVVGRGMVECTSTRTGLGEVVVETIYAGDTVGEVPFFFRLRQLNNARAGSQGCVTLFRLRREDLVQLLKLYPEEEDEIHGRCLERLERRIHGFKLMTDEAAAGASTDLWAWEEMFAKAKKAHDVARKRKKDNLILAMIFAAMKGDLAGIKKILTTSDIAVSDGDWMKRTAIHLAAAEGHFIVIQTLINDFGAEINCQDIFNGTPLADAVRQKNDDVAEFLRSIGGEMMGENPAGLLCYAALRNDVEELRRLVDNGLDPNSADYDMRTPLHIAASEGQMAALHFLLSLDGIQVNPEDRWGGTPLADALRHDQKAALAPLKAKRASLGSMDVGTELCGAASKLDLERLVMFLDNGADVNSADYDQRTALHLAASNGHAEVVDELLRRPGIDINPLDRLGGTPLEDALRGGYVDIAEMLAAVGGKRSDDPSLEEKRAAQRVLLRDRKAAQVRARTLRALKGTRESQVHTLVSEVVGKLDDLLTELQKDVFAFLEILRDLMGMGDGAGGGGGAGGGALMMDEHTRAVYRRSKEQKITRVGQALVARAGDAGRFLEEKRVAASARVSPLVHRAHPQHEMVMDVLSKVLAGVGAAVERLLESGRRSDYYYPAAAEKVADHMWVFLTEITEVHDNASIGTSSS